MMITRGEAARLLRLPGSADAFGLGARLVARYLADRTRFDRGTRLVLGNALAARLFKCLLDRDVAIWYEAMTTRLIVEHGQVIGLVARRDGRPITVRARRGIVLAGGGFPANATWRERYLPHPVPRHTPAYEGCTGSTLELALEIGASLGPNGTDNALWFPSSIATRKDGTTIVYPHIVLGPRQTGARRREQRRTPLCR